MICYVHLNTTAWYMECMRANSESFRVGSAHEQLIIIIIISSSSSIIACPASDIAGHLPTSHEIFEVPTWYTPRHARNRNQAP